VSDRESSAPPGYESFLVGRARVVAQQSLADAVREAVAARTLHQWAAHQPGARGMKGRETAWATALPNGVEIVVRHSRHGGLLAPLTGDRFFSPTRAPRELAAALRLAEAGVPTPEIAAYAVYPAFGPFVRADVATHLLRGVALPEAWHAAATDDARSALVDALVALLAALRRAGARHPDLNVRNVFILDSAASPTAAVLDVDRVMFGTAGDPAAATLNVRRLLRSMAKERVGCGVNLTSRQAQRLDATAGAGS
jgi:3-deoxy-D-manno-octulosonic acid kinase